MKFWIHCSLLLVYTLLNTFETEHIAETNQWLVKRRAIAVISLHCWKYKPPTDNIRLWPSPEETLLVFSISLLLLLVVVVKIVIIIIIIFFPFSYRCRLLPTTVTSWTGFIISSRPPALLAPAAVAISPWPESPYAPWPGWLPTGLVGRSGNCFVPILSCYCEGTLHVTVFMMVALHGSTRRSLSITGLTVA